MSLFDYFRKRQEFSVGAPVMTEEIVENGNRETDETESVGNSSSTVLINYGTGMPIDLIYSFLKEDYETKGYEDSRIALERWYDITEKAEWKNLSDIKVDFLSADYVGNQHYVFNIRGNNYRLVVVVKFTIGYVFIRWVGTHKDYDKIDCSTI